MTRSHPYIPNSDPEIRSAMLAKVGAADVDELFDSIPQELRAPEKIVLRPALASEVELRRYFDDVLATNRDTTELLSFLGGGCWNHAVPGVCDEIAGRGEFWSAFMGLGGATTSGAFQALFEYQSLIAELTDFEVVPMPSYDWAWAASTALLMAVRVTGRNKVLLADTIGPRRREQIISRLPSSVQIEVVGHDDVTGALDLQELEANLADVAGLYIENPSYLGVLEPHLDRIRKLTSMTGAKVVAGVDPTSLGLVREPSSYADFACGDLQPLGLHSTFGGSAAGFLAFNADEELVSAVPNIYLTAVPTDRDGELDFVFGNFESTSYASRGTADDVIGCGSTMHGIVAAVYLSVMGPQGMRDLAMTLRDRVDYLQHQLTAVPGVNAFRLAGTPIKETVVDFTGTGRSVEQINKALLDHDILGGLSLTKDFPALGESALYAVTEKHNQDDLDRLVATLKEILK